MKQTSKGSLPPLLTSGGDSVALQGSNRQVTPFRAELRSCVLVQGALRNVVCSCLTHNSPFIPGADESIRLPLTFCFWLNLRHSYLFCSLGCSGYQFGAQQKVVLQPATKHTKKTSVSKLEHEGKGASQLSAKPLVSCRNQMHGFT